MNQLFQQLSGGVPNRIPQYQTPMQRMANIMQAMQDPQAFVRQQFPDIPDSIANNPTQILSYLQQTRGISDQQIQQLRSLYGR